MAIYQWEGFSIAGKKLKGELEAKSEQDAFRILSSEKITVSKIQTNKGQFNFNLKFKSYKPHLKQKELVVFSRQLATLIEAGLPIVEALELLARGQTKKYFKNVIIELKQSLEAGSTLASAFKKFPNIFNELYVSLIEAGEKSGALDVMLQRIAKQLEKNFKLEREVKTAFIYPSVVLSIALVVTTILLVFVIPTFAEIFAEVGASLPLPTQVVVILSNFVVDNLLLLLVFFVVLGSFMFFFPKTQRGKNFLHPILIKLPLLGKIVTKVAIARFARTLATMLTAGVDVVNAIKICIQSAGNVVIERGLAQVLEAVKAGRTLSEPLIATHIFPDLVSSMIQVGEVTGNLDAMLSKIADFFEAEVEVAVSALKQLIEPLIILVLGVIIGGLVIAMYLPIFKLGSVV